MPTQRVSVLLVSGKLIPTDLRTVFFLNILRIRAVRAVDFLSIGVYNQDLADFRILFGRLLRCSFYRLGSVGLLCDGDGLRYGFAVLYLRNRSLG